MLAIIVSMMVSISPIRLGSRVFLRNCVAGEPGIVHDIDRAGYARVEWCDLPEVARWMRHHIDSLVVDTSFEYLQRIFDYGILAA